MKTPPDDGTALKTQLKAEILALVQQRLKIRAAKSLNNSRGQGLWNPRETGSTARAFASFHKKLNDQGLWKQMNLYLASEHFREA
jgi:hypothetical protein